MKMKKLQPLFVLAVGSLLITGCKGNNGNKSGGSSEEPDPGPSEVTPAQGIQNFVYESSEERTKILGILEKYAVENKLTGLTIFNSGGYVMYNEGVQKGATNYIPGYGFGILTEGEITQDLAGESNAAWKRYWHGMLTEDSGVVNSMNSKNSTTSDLQSYITASYFDTNMNETRDGYVWKGSLAKQNRPSHVGELDANGLSKKWRFEVKVGSEFKYNTNTANPTLAAFNNRPVELEDYVTPYKILFTQAYGMARSGESLTGAGSIAGRQVYYGATKTAFDPAAWENVGVKAYEEGGKSYLEFEFNNAYNTFFAMYYISSGMMAPVPASFIEALGGGNFAEGVKIWGANNTAGTLSPVDTWLSTGPYTLEKWDKDQQVVFKRNPNYVGIGSYNIQGVHINILEAAKTDTEAAFKEFMINKLHSCGIPSTKLDEYKNDPRATTTVGSSNFKLNLNTCTPEVWESLFGEEGKITQTPKADYWECEPAMANKDFVSGLSFAIDRQEYAKNLGRNPAFEYFAPTYLSDPENGVSYNTTDEHKEAVKSLSEGTDGYGFSRELATQAFLRASEKLIADGVYKEGDEIKIEIAWQEPTDEQEFHAPIAKYIEDAFNVDENPLSLKVEFWVGAQWDDVYYNKMMVGQFDIGFGSISGDTYNPLSFLNVLSTDKTINQNFCLNWGIDTNANTGDIVYDNHSWSFDGLFKAANEGAYIVDGRNSPLLEVTSANAVRSGDGSIVVSGTFNGAHLFEGEDLLAYGSVAGLCIYGTSNKDYTDYDEFYVYNTALGLPASSDPTDTGSYLTVDEEKGTFEAHFSATVASYFSTLGTYAAGFDLYSVTYMIGDEKPSMGFYGTIIDELPE